MCYLWCFLYYFNDFNDGFMIGIMTVIQRWQ